MAELAHDKNDPSIWCIQGAVNYQTVMSLTDTGRKWLKQSDLKRCTIDFSNLSHFNSALLSMILCWYRLAASLGVKIVFQSVPVLAYRMAEIYGLSFLLEDS